VDGLLAGLTPHPGRVAQAVEDVGTMPTTVVAEAGVPAAR
jgi:hypothetical protein